MPMPAAGMASAGTALGERERRFVERVRLAHLATADRNGVPHVLPVCFALDGGNLYVTVDEKPKRQGSRLKRLRNIACNPQVALVIDLYDDTDWSRLAWVMLRGVADILESGAEHDHAQNLLRARYPQYRTMVLAPLPVIAVRVMKFNWWGAIGQDIACGAGVGPSGSGANS